MRKAGKIQMSIVAALFFIFIASSLQAQGIYVDFGNRIRSRHMENVGNTVGSDGETVAAVIETQFCAQSVGGAIYFAIDNEILYQRAEGVYNIINFEYFDASEREIKLVYDSQTDPDKELETVITTTGSNSWKSVSLYLDDAYFGNRQKYNADFRLECVDTMTINVVRVVPIDYYIDFGDFNDEYLITQTEIQGGDSKTEIIWVGDEDCITGTEESQYLYCNVDDGEIFEGDFIEYFISVEYYDSDPALQLRLQYDSTDDPYKSTSWISGKGWESFKTYTWEVKDGYMGGRQNGGSDFRINLPQPGLLVNRIFLGYLDYGPSKIEKKSSRVENFRLGQNYPNPFNPTTSIQYNVAQQSEISLKIYNLRGELVRTLVDAEQSAGVYNQKWDGLDNVGAITPSGLYVYRLVANDFMQSHKMIKLK
jgi:hypothetical protein